MAKAKTAKPKKKQEKRTKEESCGIDPKGIHALLGIPDPYDVPKEPPGWPGWITFWDCGLSVATLLWKHRELFAHCEWFPGHSFAKATDSWRWKQLRLPILPGEPFEKQAVKLRKGDQIATVREVILHVAVHFLLTGERLEFGRVRCRDLLPNLRRVNVSFSKFGFDIGTCTDEYVSPSIGLAAVFVPLDKRR